MSSDIQVSINRAGTQTTASVPVQLDTMSIQAASYYGGAAPYFRYMGFIDYPVDIEEGDLLIDLVNPEPRTSPANTRTKQYRVISDPESFPDGHIEFACDRMIGNTP